MKREKKHLAVSSSLKVLFRSISFLKQYYIDTVFLNLKHHIFVFKAPYLVLYVKRKNITYTHFILPIIDLNECFKSIVQVLQSVPYSGFFSHTDMCRPHDFTMPEDNMLHNCIVKITLHGFKRIGYGSSNGSETPPLFH